MEYDCEERHGSISFRVDFTTTSPDTEDLLEDIDALLGLFFYTDTFSLGLQITDVVKDTSTLVVGESEKCE